MFFISTRRLTGFVFLFLILTCPAIAQKTVVLEGRVVDEATGEGLPYVNVYAGDGRGAITNINGSYSLKTLEGQQIRFSFVGYKTIKMLWNKVPKVLKMKELVTSLDGVTVLTDESVLMKVVKTMEKDFSKNRLKDGFYFNRISVRHGQTMEMIEGFFEARVAINLRQLKLSSGKYWAKNLLSTDDGRVKSSMTRTDFHVLMMLGPMIRDEKNWDELTIPIPHGCSNSHFKRFYDITTTRLTEDDKLIYRFEFRPKKADAKNIMTGTLYVDGDTYRPIKFDGKINNIDIYVTKGNEKNRESDVDFKLHIGYDTESGFTKVNDMTINMEHNGIGMQNTLVNVDAYNLPLTYGEKIGKNLLAAIDYVGSNPEVEKDYSFMKRTEEEEMLVNNTAGDTEVKDVFLEEGGMASGLMDEVRNKKDAKSGKAMSEDAHKVMGYIKNAMHFNMLKPQEKIYLHLDNTGYFKDETVWFKAYCVRSDTERQSDLSNIVYVELLAPNGELISRRKLYMKNGVGWGDIKLANLKQTGFYEIRAYTRYQTNWGTNVCYSRVIPVFEKPKPEGNYYNPTLDILSRSERLNDKRGQDEKSTRSEVKQQEKSAIKSGLDLVSTGTDDTTTDDEGRRRNVNVRCFPEGGNCITGIEGRVALSVTDKEGLPLQNALCEVTDGDSILYTAETNPDGFAHVTVSPEPDKKYRVNVTAGKHSRTVDLPKAVSEGCGLMVDMMNDDRIEVVMRTTPGLHGRMLGYVVMHGGNILQCDTLKAETEMKLTLDRSRMPAGVSQLTVFDTHGQICSERLMFVCPQPSMEDSVKVIRSSDYIKSCGLVELTLVSQPITRLSFSATDAATTVNGRVGNIRSWMLLDSEVRGYIAHPEYYLEADDAEHRSRADLLMMVQGWRRYDWNLMTGRKQLEKWQMIEDRQYLTGRLFGKMNARKDSVDIHVVMYNTQGLNLKGDEMTDSTGTYLMGIPDIIGTWNMQIAAGDEDKWKNYVIGIDRNFEPRSRMLSAAECMMQPVDSAKVFNWLVDIDEPLIPVPIGDKVLDEVEVKSRRKWKNMTGWTDERSATYFSKIEYDCDMELDRYLDAGRNIPTLSEWLMERNELFGGSITMSDIIVLLPRSIFDPITGAKIVYEDRAGFRKIVFLSEYDPTHQLSLDAAPLPEQATFYSDGLKYKGRPIVWIVDNKFVTISGMIFRGDVFGTDRVESIEENPRYIRTGNMMIRNLDQTKSITDLPATLDEVNKIYISEDIAAMHEFIDIDKVDEMNPVTVYVYTHRRGTKIEDGVRRTYYQGYSQPSMFTMEDYSVVPPMNDFRRTIFWQPDIVTDQQGKASVKFYNNSSCTDMYISVEGMDNKGNFIAK